MQEMNIIKHGNMTKKNAYDLMVGTFYLKNCAGFWLRISKLQKLGGGGYQSP